MAKKSRAQRKQQGAQRSNRRKAQRKNQPSNVDSRSAQILQSVDSSAPLVTAAPKEVSRPASRTTKAASKGNTPNVKRQSVDWEGEYANVVNDLHMLMIVSIFLFIIIIGAGSFIT